MLSFVGPKYSSSLLVATHISEVLILTFGCTFVSYISHEVAHLTSAGKIINNNNNNNKIIIIIIIIIIHNNLGYGVVRGQLMGCRWNL